MVKIIAFLATVAFVIIFAHVIHHAMGWPNQLLYYIYSGGLAAVTFSCLEFALRRDV